MKTNYNKEKGTKFIIATKGKALIDLGAVEPFEIEQIAYRLEQCKDDCGKEGRCKECGCNFNKMMYAQKSCNQGERFPETMNEQDWEQFKKENNIEFN